MIVLVRAWRIACLVLPIALLACAAGGESKLPATSAQFSGRSFGIVAMRRLTEAQYRNAISDIFGADIKIDGRFEPILRPVHHLIETGASSAALSPSGLGDFDAIAREVAAQVVDDRHRADFVQCQPRDIAGPDAECAGPTLTRLGRYLFRRPLSPEEQADYLKMAELGASQTKSFYSGLKLAVAAMLISPEFLYVQETAEPDPDHPGQLRLDSISRASRLSFLLWNTTPDETLLNAGERGQLTDPRKLSEIAERMVKSSRFEQGVRAFFSDLLVFEKFDELSKDPIIYRRFNRDVAKALPEQMLLTIVDYLLTHNGDYRNLFTTRRTFMTRALGSLYEVPVKSRTEWEPYEFSPNDERGGLLSQAGFLALYSQSGRSSPTLRGRALRELLLCERVPDPPGNVNFTAVQDVNNPLLPTARVRLAAHANNPVCSGCHHLTDPIGLGLEKFDGIGAFRETENGAPIDASGTLNGVSFQSAQTLGKAVAADPAAPKCVVNRALEYATSRSQDDAGDDVAALIRTFASQGYNIRALFLRISTMPESYRVPSVPRGVQRTALSISREDAQQKPGGLQ